MAELIPGVYDQLVDGWLAARMGELDAHRLRAMLLDVDPAAGMDASPIADRENEIGRGVGRLLHVDDLDRLARYRRLLRADKAPVTVSFNELDRRALHGLLLTILSPRKGTFADLDAAARALWHHGELRRELIEVLDLLDDQVMHLTTPLRTNHPVPLAVHAS